MGCPESDDLLAFAEGKLSEPRRERLEEHLDACESCHTVAAELARVYLDSAAERTAPQTPAAAAMLAPGSRLGRYHILEPLGSGAMGVVYAAYDDDLDRKIALKVLRPRAGARLVLVREAQAMARLSHPNVITVHEASEAEGRVFLAMEFVDGQTLREWVDEQPRRWTEIYATFHAVAQGLAAAHDAGLVHRDVKPDNVLVGRDGRVLVTDFGLARAATAPLDAQGETAATAPLEARLTREGALVGTPAYMAPEQFAGETADALSDQFGYCVALFEALYGCRPFAGSSIAEIGLAVEAGDVREPSSDRDVPRWLHQIVVRGLAVQPSARFPSLQELLRAMQRGRGTVRRRRQALALFGALAVGGGVAWSVVALGRAPCRGADEKLVGVWDPARRSEAKEALLSVDAPYAEDTWTRARGALDTYARSWTEMHVEACLATAVRKEQSEEVMDARMRCLDQRRRALDGLVKGMLEADVERLPHVSRSLDALPPLQPCADLEALRSAVVPPDDPATRARIAAVREDLVEVTRLQVAGRYSEAVERLEELRESAADLDYRPFQAELLLQLGSRQAEAGAKADAEASLTEAAWLARASGADAIVRDASIELVEVSAAAAGKAEPGLAWARQAWAEVERSGLGGIDEASLRLAEAIVLRHAARYDDARETLLTSLKLLEAEFGPEHPHVATALGQLGPIEEELGHFDGSLAALRRALGIYEATYGPHHPDVGYVLSNLARVQFTMADYEASLRTRLRALDVLSGALPADHPHLATTHGSLGNVLTALGRPEEGIVELRQAVEIDTARFGADHAGVATDLYNLSIAELNLGRTDDAVAHVERAVEILEKLGDDSPHPLLGQILAGYSDTLQKAGRDDEAIDAARRSISVHRAVHAGDRPELGIALVNLGATLAQLERWGEAEPPLTEGIAMLEEHLGKDHDYVATGIDVLATVKENTGDMMIGLELTERAHAIRTTKFKADHPDMAVSHHNLGAAYERRGNDDDARAHYERAWKIFTALEAPPSSHADTALALARVLWRAGEHKRARTLVEGARVKLAAMSDTPAAASLADAETWLAKHQTN